MLLAEQNLLKTLSNNDVTFFIPPYQRNYEWDKAQCSVFLDDVLNTYSSNKEKNICKHFFGTITYFANEPHFGQPTKLVLIDGQQRITTTMLFLAAIRDIIKDEKMKEYIDSKFLKNTNSTGKDDEYKIKLKQVESDWEVYKNIILNLQIEEDQQKTAVYKNYKWFNEKLLSEEKKGVQLSKLIELGINQFTIASVQLEPERNEWENPQEIFESMNSLGKPLSLADLVRNHLLLGLDAETQTRFYNQYWLKIEKTLPNQMSNYLRDVMQMALKKSCAKATDANHKKLYAQFKITFNKFEPEELLCFLNENARFYAALVSDNKIGIKKIDRALWNIKKLKVTTAASFLLSLLIVWNVGKFTNEELVDILNAFTIYLYRRRFILGLPASEHKKFPEWSGYLNELIGAKDKKKKMFEFLASQDNSMRLPNDLELKRTIENLNFYNFKYSKLYLALIEEAITKGCPDLNDVFLQKEHIMPQTLSDEWKKDLGQNYSDIHTELLNTIGNITLIRHNQELGNKSFTEKKEIYMQKSGLQIAKSMIIDRDEWNEKTIKERTEWLIEIILNQLFPIPDDMRKINNFK